MRPEEAAERAFEAQAKAAVAALLGGPERVEEGPFHGQLEASVFPRLNFYAAGPASDMAGSQRVIVTAETRVWQQADQDGSRAQLREIDGTLATALEEVVVEQPGHRVHVLTVGSFQPIPGNHPNIRGRRRVYSFQVIAHAQT